MAEPKLLSDGIVNVKFGERVKVVQPANVYGCEIGDDCFIGHGVMFVNDLFQTGGPARGDKSLWKSTHVGSRVSLGSNATILPVRICDDVVIGTGAVVTKDITQPGIYAGNPARLLRPLKGKAP
jgi:acetyltransferase-like isoleucine patch superfamily enzyme